MEKIGGKKKHLGQIAIWPSRRTHFLKYLPDIGKYVIDK